MTDSDVRRIEDALTGVRLELSEMRGELKGKFERIDDQDKQIEDHETRLRTLENFRSSVPKFTTSVSVIALLCTFVEAAYYATHLHH